MRTVDGRPVRRPRRRSRCSRERTAFWITDILVRRRGARLRLRPRRQPRVPVHRRGEDRHLAGVPRQLGDRLHARCDRRRLGRQFRSHAAREFVGRHRRRPDLSRCHAGGRRARRRGSLPIDDFTPIAAPTRRRPARRALRGLRPDADRRLPATRDRVGAGRRGDRRLHVASRERSRRRDGLARAVPALGAARRTAARHHAGGRATGDRGGRGALRRRRRDQSRSRRSPDALHRRRRSPARCISFDPTLRPEFQTLPLRAQGATRRARVVRRRHVDRHAGAATPCAGRSRRAHTKSPSRTRQGKSAETKVVVK